MRSRCLLFITAVAVGACQKKAETVLEVPMEYRQKGNPASRTLNEIDTPAAGVIAGKQFTPDNVVFEGRSLSFRKGKDFFPEMEMKFDLPAGKLEGKEWKFEGDKFENPTVMVANKNEPATFLFPKDYTMTIKITKETAKEIEGKIDLHAQTNTHLTGSFTATRKKTANDPLEADDAPYVHGKINFVGPWTEKNTAVGFAIGFVGIGADGSPHSNMVGSTMAPMDSGLNATSLTFRPQLTNLTGDNKGTMTYRHTKVPPGEYLVYIKRNTVLAAWQKVTLKAGDQLTADLTIDPTKTGELVVIFPDEEINDTSHFPLSLRPVGLEMPGSELSEVFKAAEVKAGQKTVTVKRVPAGKYLALRGKSHGEVEVVAGKSTAVTLVREEPKKK